MSSGIGKSYKGHEGHDPFGVGAGVRMKFSEGRNGREGQTRVLHGGEYGDSVVCRTANSAEPLGAGVRVVFHAKNECRAQATYDFAQVRAGRGYFGGMGGGSGYMRFSFFIFIAECEEPISRPFPRQLADGVIPIIDERRSASVFRF